MQQQQLKPRYEVHDRRDETVTETRQKRDAEKGINVAYDVEVDYGFDVYFPNGNSMRVKTFEELQRLGFDGNAVLIDMETGDEVQPVASLKTQAKRGIKTKAKKPETSGIDASV